MVVVEDTGGSVAPEVRHAFGYPGDGAGVIFVGAEVVGSGEACGFGGWGEEFFGEADVAVDGFEDVLPGANGLGAADADGFAGEEPADEIGDEAVGGPVAAADDVTGAGGGDGYFVFGEFVDGEIDWRKAAETSSAQALELEYGS